MKHREHCNLCKHVDANLSKGILCGLTNKKPNFHISCSTFKLSSRYKYQLTQLQKELEKMQSKRRRFRSSFYTWMIIGTLFMLLGLYLFNLSSQTLIYMKLSFSVSTIGVLVWWRALDLRMDNGRKINSIHYRLEKFEKIAEHYQELESLVGHEDK